MVNVQVYGTKVICASCVGMPSSTETFEWLQAAIGRKYEGQENKFNFEYIDFQEEQVLEVLDKLRPFLLRDGGDVELVDIEEGIVKLRLMGACGSCPSSTITLKAGIERAL
ncbi:DUF1462 family protein, partial [Bacillus sp. SS-TM]